MADDGSPTFDPADLFGDDAESGEHFTRSLEDFFKGEEHKDTEKRRQELLDKYKAAKAAALAQRAKALGQLRHQAAPGAPPGSLAPLPPLAQSPSALPPLPPLSPLPPLPPLKGDGHG
jgi:hypothetical protein